MKPNKGKKIETQATSSVSVPSQDQINRVLSKFQTGGLVEAEALALSLTQQFPKHAFGWTVLAATLNQMGRLTESLAAQQEATKLSPQDAEAHYNLGITLNEVGRNDEAKRSYQTSIALKPTYAEAHFNLGNTLVEVGELADAEVSYRQAIALQPDHAQAHSNLGSTLRKLGRLGEAEALYKSAISLQPDDAQYHSNLGVTLHELGKLGEAEESCKKAIALEPGSSQAHYNLGVTLQELGTLNEAEASYRRAIGLEPGYAQAHNNLGVTLKKLGRPEEAISSYVRAINLKADLSSAYSNLGVALTGIRFVEEDQSLYPILLDLITEADFVRPADVAEAILSLLRLNASVKDLLLKTPIDPDIKEVGQATEVLAKIPLLKQLMRVCPLPDLEFEAVFTSIRRVILNNLRTAERSPETIDFLSTLSLHCFTNEFVYSETGEELELVSDLETRIAKCIAQTSQPTLIEVLCLATYRPLHKYDWSERLQVLQQLPEVQSRLLDEPRAERAIALDIPVLARINDEVSREVRDQYENNPYPRWVRLRIPPRAKSVAEVCDEGQLRLHCEAIRRALSPSILIAGCGTGQHSIETASRFINSQVTAVDLSRASLSYARRKTSALGITNIAYLQADILHLEELGQQFDIVESSGVLHHMDDPMAGWRVLTNLLKSGGLMKIGLYSESARRHIVMIREEIAARDIGTSATEIKQFRQSVIKSHDRHHQRLKTSVDFFSLSTLRDLIFHVQEHRFTIMQIESCLNELGLKFCGFKNNNTDIFRTFKKSFGDEADTCDLSLWHQFEESHPSTFAAMYQFWCQKI